MGLLDKLKESYRNGKEQKRLLRKKFDYYGIMDDSSPDSGIQDMLYQRIIKIKSKA